MNLMFKKEKRMPGFVSHSSNPIRGACAHDCLYCYMKGIYERFGQDQTLRLDEDELKCIYGNGKFIFMGSSRDAWADNVPTEWIIRMYDHCLEYPENKYLLQSKNPMRFLEPGLISHPFMEEKEIIVFGTTLESNRDYKVSKAPCVTERIEAIKKLHDFGFKVSLSIEPLMDFDVPDMFQLISEAQPCMVAIGLNTSNRVKLPEPTKDKVIALLQGMDQMGITIFKKDSLKDFLKR